MTKKLVLNFTGYRITGISDLTPWGGGNACIEMKPFLVKSIDKRTLLKNINDNGFGVENINGAICDIWENYEGTYEYLKSVEVGNISEHTREVYNNI